MKLLIIGGNGMAGHMIRNYLSQNRQDEIYYIHRTPNDLNGIYLDCTETLLLKALIFQLKPNIIINCAGILNQQANENMPNTIQINSFLPHQLAEWLDVYQGQLIHISTDCVFSGTKGLYLENDLKDSRTAYGRSKALGEVEKPHHLTIRTSIIGPELKKGIGLFQWFMNQEKKVYGFDRVHWNGVTTLELAAFISAAIDQHWDGLYHLTSAEALSKYELLTQMKDVFQKDITIVRDSEKSIDRTLMNTRQDISYQSKPTLQMLKELKDWMRVNDKG